MNVYDSIMIFFFKGVLFDFIDSKWFPGPLQPCKGSWKPSKHDPRESGRKLCSRVLPSRHISNACNQACKTSRVAAWLPIFSTRNCSQFATVSTWTVDCFRQQPSRRKPLEKGRPQIGRAASRATLWEVARAKRFSSIERKVLLASFCSRHDEKLQDEQAADLSSR